jgi:hypothetical protein
MKKLPIEVEDLFQTIKGQLSEQDALNALKELHRYCVNIRDALDDHERLLDLIPSCPEHGDHCLPYARQWVKKVKALTLHTSDLASDAPPLLQNQEIAL